MITMIEATVMLKLVLKKTSDEDLQVKKECSCEKKKERLMKENESEQTDEGLNLSVSKNGGSEHTTKLEALLAKPIDDMPHHSDKGVHNTNGEPPRTEGV